MAARLLASNETDEASGVGPRFCRQRGQAGSCLSLRHLGAEDRAPVCKFCIEIGNSRFDGEFVPLKCKELINIDGESALPNAVQSCPWGCIVSQWSPEGMFR